ncbi:cbb3-type cytochrome oxidase assembly protein CcoS [Chryseobacterium sp. 3008163]|uniref:cbb3-type cytochrome oxidase assembly protein CcoS n=1 Tax=Chryseobacterium sp. 3008163 TaxID=2478663 RepID=UPI000F0D1431|nr:cbb3-type cytochrome oxidase assembly protein CcoS [Chryseobacterium sp. 3008163]AYN01055.1 cbb3-type cytochrome oxidase assembly protein CcoS [Chryseobacterium sp. 3008163]
MDILYLMILCSVSLAAVFLIVFIVNARKGQFEDDESPAVRILFDDEIKEEKEDSGNKNDKSEKGESNKFEEKSE